VAVELREGVRFHDGTEMTAEDVAWTFDRIARAGSRNIKAAEDGTRVIDEHTVEFTPSEPNVKIPQQLVHPIFGIMKAGSDPVAAPVGTVPVRRVCTRRAAACRALRLLLGSGARRQRRLGHLVDGVDPWTLTVCLLGSASGSGWPAPSCSTRRCCSSTLDEPISALDPSSGARILSTLAALCRDLGRQALGQDPAPPRATGQPCEHCMKES
jgi:Bacterial extracellular solute-binding proteins, family 5 Middle